MSDSRYQDQEEIFSQIMRAGRRTYFFDVRATRAGDYYLTITESKKFTEEDGSYHFRKHKIFLYKEDFKEFSDHLTQATDFILKEKGEEVISERHQKDFVKPTKAKEAPDAKEKPEAKEASDAKEAPEAKTKSEDFTDVKFEDI